MNIITHALFQLLPKSTVSRVFGGFSRMHIPVVSKISAKLFARHYKINLAEAVVPNYGFENIHDLFTRRLINGARPIEDNAEVVSPVDGVLTQHGYLSNHPELIQAKGKYYTLESLLRNKELAEEFAEGYFATIYLSPHNYHRIHSPVSGNVTAAYYCPGSLYPVNMGSANRIEGLFAINERLITQIDTYDDGKMLLVKVGATNVGRIAVEYNKEWFTNSVPPISDRNAPYTRWDAETHHPYTKGQEIARFEMGSTVIMVFNKKIKDRTHILMKSLEGKEVKMGQGLMV